MRGWFTWLLVFGVIAGSCCRMLAVDPCESLLKMHASEHSHHDHDPCQPCDPQHDSDCPVEHHHHNGCCHPSPMVADAMVRLSTATMDFSLSLLAREAWLQPDEPVQDLDKPPLV